MSIRDVNTNQFIEKVSQKLKDEKVVEAPDWSEYVKTGAHVMRVPENSDWWYTRSAAILRRVYLQGPLGVGKLRKWFGGKKNRGVKPEKHVDAGGKIIRTCLQQLENAGFIKKNETGGRVITPKGQSFLDKVSSEMDKTAPKKETKKKVEEKKPKKEEKVAEEKPKKEEKKPAKKTAKTTGKKAVKKKEEKVEKKKETKKKEAKTVEEKKPAKKVEEKAEEKKE